MRQKTYIKFVIAISLLVFRIPVAWAVTVTEIAQELTCTCGCNMVVSACEGTMDCSAAADIKQQILDQLDQGQSKEEIIRLFVNQYGEQILSSPTKKGFNLTAWVLPFVVVLIGIGGLYVALKNWASQTKPGLELVSFPQEDTGYLEQVEEELKTFDT